MANVYDITLHRGENYFLQITAKDASGIPINLGGYTASGLVKHRYSDTGFLFDLHPVITIPLSGIMTVSLLGAETTGLPITQAVYSIDVFSGVNTQNILGGDFSITPCTLA